MGPQAQTIWDGLEFRTPAILEAVQDLSEFQVGWAPPGGGNSIAWLLWHISEVEDNWVRDRLLGLPKRYPFGASVRAAAGSEWPRLEDLLRYFAEARALTKSRLEGTPESAFDGSVQDPNFGSITVRQVWSGVVTSCAWHGGQIVLIKNRLLPAGRRAE